jgi:hypothetical protein
VYVVRPVGGHRALPGAQRRMYLIAVTGTPMTISTARIEATTKALNR